METIKEFIGLRFGWPQGIPAPGMGRMVLVTIHRTWTGDSRWDRILFEMFGTVHEENEGWSKN